MTFDEAQILKDTSPRWFCVRAQPKHEQLAAVSLRRILGVECFAPRIRYRKITQRGPVWFVEAMFPGYLFARFVFAELYRQAQSMPGVTGIVRFGSRIAALPETTIAELRTASGDDELIVFNPEPKVNDAVKIASGAFIGLEAIVTQVLPSKERVRVLLDFLGRQIEAEISSPQVIPASSPRENRGG